MIWVFYSTYNFFYNLIQTYPALYEALKVVLAGAFFEASRRGSKYLAEVIVDSLTLKARIGDNDEAFDWLHHYLSTHVPIPISHGHSLVNEINPYAFKTILWDSIWPSGISAPRDVQIATRKPRGRWWYGWSSESYSWGKDVLGGYKEGVKVSIVPTVGKMQIVKFQGKTIKMGIIKSDDWAFDSDKWFVMSTFLGTHKTFTQLLTAARNEYQSLSSGSTAIYSPRGRDDAGWYRSNTRPSRPWESVILPDGVKEWLLADMEEFLREKRFYEMRGLPWRRRYLFYGVPGSGKSSLIAALAYKLQLSIYLINLGAKGLDDDKLQGLLQACPGNCILLMEDIDCAFKKRKSKKRSKRRSSSSSSSESSSSPSDSDSDSSSSSKSSKKMAKKDKKDKKAKDIKDKTNSNGNKPPQQGFGSNITLSGLLNALDGVASSEGRLLFCTTNWVDKIDEALSRPGRCDVWIEFSNATKEQINNLFLQFYRPASSNPLTPSSSGTSTPEDKSWISEKVNHTLSLTYPDTLKRDVDNDIDIASLANQFSEAIPEGKVSVSALQGYLMRYKREPVKALDGVRQWIESGCGKGPTMTLTKKGVEMREVEKGDSEEEEAKDKSRGKQGKKDKKEKKDKDKTKKDKKDKKGDKEDANGMDMADSEEKKHDSESKKRVNEEVKEKEINGDNDEKANGNGTTEKDASDAGKADATEGETHIEEIGNE